MLLICSTNNNSTTARKLSSFNTHRIHFFSVYLFLFSHRLLLYIYFCYLCQRSIQYQSYLSNRLHTKHRFKVSIRSAFILLYIFLMKKIFEVINRNLSYSNSIFRSRLLRVFFCWALSIKYISELLKKFLYFCCYWWIELVWIELNWEYNLILFMFINFKRV